eukprot:GILJ01001352.1.p1 GENE.GILJ01001352.1~~GILJ01001352.1.p1  ORF type:complete len:543 (+),score=107.45 GILJ01001352.1:38-1666(+)
MVVLSAAIATKQGKTLVARQFVEMTRIRIEGLLSAFPKLIGSGKQHTYVETETVRYVYQPMESLFLLLITNKASNILEDLETLRLLSKVVQEWCQNVIDEDGVLKNAFDLVFAFDEVISMGYRESVSLPQIKTYCEMESHEEKLHQMIKISKMNEAKELAKKKMMEMDRRRAEVERQGGSGYGSGIGSNSGFGPSGGYGPSAGNYGQGGSNPTSSSGFGSSSQYNRPEPQTTPKTSSGRGPTEPALPTSKAPSKGMQLGAKNKKSDAMLSSLRSEGEALEVSPTRQPSDTSAPAPSATYNPLQGAVQVLIEEKLVVQLNRDGGVNNLEIKGDLYLTILDENKAKVAVRMQQGPNSGYQFKLHPNMNKQQWGEQSILGLRDPSRPYPVNNKTPVLKWRLQGKDEAMVPLMISCWPSPTAGGSTVNIEYELLNRDVELSEVSIFIPISNGQPPQVSQVDGLYKFRPKESQLEWRLASISSSNPSGSLEFSAPVDPASVFPVTVSFTAASSFCQLDVVDVSNIDDQQPVTYEVRKMIATEDYNIS